MGSNHQNRQAGFTLLELMIAVALTSLLTLVAYASLSLCLKVVQRGQAAAENLQELRVGQSILERSLSSAVRGSLGNRVYFVGGSEQMSFFTRVPLEAHSLGGIYHWRVLLGQDQSGQGVLAVEETKNVNWYRDPEGVEVRQIILHNVASVQFTYGRDREEAQTWDTKRDGGLPHWVKVSLAQVGREPQVLIIPIHVAEFKKAESTP